MICPSCKAANPDDGTTCLACGAGLARLFRPGQILASRYEIVAPLGRGGMGVVYQAHDNVLDEIVALKVLRNDFDDASGVAQRFRAEIKLARRVAHRNVCRIYEYGQHGELHFISMELIKGTDLRRLLRDRGSLPVPEAFEVSLQVLDGLRAIHEAGVIHRDLKATNIMVDDRGIARLMDFGIAKQWGLDGPSGITAIGQIIGTPEYMSPEQARAEPIDFRSDIYSMGIVLFEIFTGHVPFQAPTPLQTIFKHLHEPPPLTGAHAFGIPAPLVTVLHKALAKELAERFQSVAELRDAVREARDLSTGMAQVAAPPAAMATTTVSPPTMQVESTVVVPTPPPARAHVPTPPPGPAPAASPRASRGGAPRTAVVAVVLAVSVAAVWVFATMRKAPTVAVGPTAEPTASIEPAPSAEPAPIAVVSPPVDASPSTPLPVGPTTVRRPSPAVATASPSGRTGIEPTRSAAVPTPTPIPERAAEGMLHVVVRPWAEVSVDGRSVGTTPLGAVALPAGVHLVRLAHPEFRPLQRRVAIQPGETTSLRVDLTLDGVPLRAP
jgi:hypothetical protein